MPLCSLQKLLLLLVAYCNWNNVHAQESPALSCVPIRDCPHIYNLTKQQLSNVEAVFQLLKKTQCGFDDTNHPKVWCKQQIEQQECLTSDGINGTCTPKEKCPTDTSSEWITLGHSKENVCGEDNTQVCCAVKIEKTEEANLPLPGECGYHPFSRKIFGGKETELDEFTWMGLMQYKTGNTIKQACSASLINRKFLVTAAHCADPAAVKDMGYSKLDSVVLGEYNTQTEIDCIEYEEDYRECADKPIVIPIKSIVLHPEWSYPGRENDIALLELLTPVTYTDFIKPICLPLEGWRSSENESLLITGWGKSPREARTATKMRATVKHMPCLRSTVATQICAGGKGVDICSGDSGGPLMFGKFVGKHYYMFLGGIASYGTRRCGAAPSVYTLVPNYLEWIKSNIEK